MRANNIIKIGLFVLLIGCATTAQVQSQAQMNTRANAEYQKSDKELNVVYQRILKEYASEPVFIKNLKTAQHLWVQLRDAEVATKYPAPETYGSAELMCKASYLNNLTKDRIKFLKIWLTGIEEGDGCIGSVKTK